MTGIRLILFIIALLGLAIALQAGLVAFAGYVVLGVVLFSRYISRQWIANLSAERKCNTEPREVGDTADVAVQVTNSGTIPIAWVLVEDMAPEKAVARNRLSLKGSRLRVLFLRPGQTKPIKYKLTFQSRGYYPVGPMVAETGDVFGLHRRHRVLTQPAYIMVYPRIIPLPGYDFTSKRPIGEVRLANRLYEDPTRTAGVRPYMLGDPLQRVHWRATARTGELHSRVYEPTSLAGATIVIDFHKSAFPKRGEPMRSDLAVTAACSLAYAVSMLGQQVGLASNGRDAAERIRAEAFQPDGTATSAEGAATRFAARERFELLEKNDRLRPVVVETRRGIDQFQMIREALARLEITNGMSFAEMLIEVAPRLPKDATVIAILATVPVETAVALGQLRRQGFAVSALLVGFDDEESRTIAFGRLASETIRDVRVINTEADLMSLGDPNATPIPAEYGIAVALA